MCDCVDLEELFVNCVVSEGRQQRRRVRVIIDIFRVNLEAFPLHNTILSSSSLRVNTPADHVSRTP